MARYWSTVYKNRFVGVTLNIRKVVHLEINLWKVGYIAKHLCRISYIKTYLFIKKSQTCYKIKRLMILLKPHKNTTMYWIKGQMHQYQEERNRKPDLEYWRAENGGRIWQDKVGERNPKPFPRPSRWCKSPRKGRFLNKIIKSHTRNPE